MENKWIMLLGLAGALLIVGNARAESIPELTAFFQNQIAGADAALENSTPAGAQPANASFDEDWYYRRFWMRVRAPVGITVPWIATFQIIPEVEMLWERDYPSGWSTYKP
jgi:hypothetical protein